ncbi:alkaline D-peptidase [Serinibacter arcticus]|uniref:Alkaline D-peptidase n=1 Tax=Serinibacter arcticus TaxID=1655435 RepID=A0A2U1ZXN9_9MICO|nr:serine hydrolase domain-containing protein [Serinibacter arcticus]PWD51757.1 alkaline D-peptidase [Serinibacter arcticus]
MSTTPVRTRRLAALLTTGALLAGCAAGSEPGDATPTAEEPSASSSSPGETSAPTGSGLAPEVEAALDAVIEAGAVAVQIEVRDGDDVTSAARGTADLTSGREASPDDAVRIASISKTAVAVVVLQLVEAGSLELDTTVQEVLPGLLRAAPADVTVRQLLEHSSGMPNYTEVLAPDVTTALTGLGEPRTAQDLVELSQQQPWVAEPGSGFHYSHVGYTVLGLLAESVTGQPMRELLAERVIEPVGMTSTSYPTDETLPDDALRGYLAVDGEPVETTGGPPWFWSDGAALVSTVGDVGAMIAALGRGELLEPATVEQMHDVGDDGYGFGVLAGGDACPSASPGGAPALVYGQRGNGFGYNSLTLGSPDGERVVTVAYTGGTFDPATDPVFPPVNQLVAVALGSTCGV